MILNYIYQGVSYRQLQAKRTLLRQKHKVQVAALKLKQETEMKELKRRQKVEMKALQNMSKKIKQERLERFRQVSYFFFFFQSMIIYLCAYNISRSSHFSTTLEGTCHH